MTASTACLGTEGANGCLVDLLDADAPSRSFAPSSVSTPPPSPFGWQGATIPFQSDDDILLAYPTDATTTIDRITVNPSVPTALLTQRIVTVDQPFLDCVVGDSAMYAVTATGAEAGATWLVALDIPAIAALPPLCSAYEPADG